MRFRRPALALSSAATLLLGACTHYPPSPVCEYRVNSLELCELELSRGDLDRAEVYCSLGLEFSPQHPDLWATRGRIALLRQDTAQAQRYLLQALEYAPDHPQAIMNLGFTYLEQRRFGEAEAAFLHCARLKETLADCQAGLERARHAAAP